MTGLSGIRVPAEGAFELSVFLEDAAGNFNSGWKAGPLSLVLKPPSGAPSTWVDHRPAARDRRQSRRPTERRRRCRSPARSSRATSGSPALGSIGVGGSSRCAARSCPQRRAAIRLEYRTRRGARELIVRKYATPSRGRWRGSIKLGPDPCKGPCGTRYCPVCRDFWHRARAPLASRSARAPLTRHNTTLPSAPSPTFRTSRPARVGAAMPLCFIEPQDAIRVIAESVGREARRQLLGELVRAWVDEIPEEELDVALREGRRRPRRARPVDARRVARVARGRPADRQPRLPRQRRSRRLGENRREALKIAAGFRGEEAFDAGVAEEQAMETVLPHLSPRALRCELADRVRRALPLGPAGLRQLARTRGGGRPMPPAISAIACSVSRGSATAVMPERRAPPRS